MIRLEDVTPDNWRSGLAVGEDQRRFVAESAGILARAYAYRNERSRALIIYNDETPVGMALYYDIPDWECYNFSQFFIDRRYQGRGFGLDAAKQIVDLMRADGRYDKIVLCYVEGDDAAKKLYEKLGFRHTGDDEDGEIVMELILR
jgi:Acetyltransferases, including N-acetylases of ribosomal proteins